jgi:hypothetical protein
MPIDVGASRFIAIARSDEKTLMVAKYEPLRNKDFLKQSRRSRSDSARPSAHLLPTLTGFSGLSVPSAIFASRSTAPQPLAFLH